MKITKNSNSIQFAILVLPFILVWSECVFALESKNTEVKVSGDAFVRAHSKDRTGKSADAGFTHFFRLKTDYAVDQQVSMRLGALYSSTKAEGDFKTNTSESSTTAHTGREENVKLDEAFLTYKYESWTIQSGRMAVSSPQNFLTSDDRRDRIMALNSWNTHTLVFIFDKRAEGAFNNGRDDLNMYSVNYYGMNLDQSNSKFYYALQSGYFAQRKPSVTGHLLKLRDVMQLTPELTWVSGSQAHKVDVHYSILGNGTGDASYKDWHQSFALKYTANFDWGKLEASGIYTVDGGLVALGYDTLSSVINNSAYNYQSSINLINIGSALGAKKADETLIMARYSKMFTPKLEIGFGGGHSRTYSFTRGKLINNRVWDHFVKYQVSEKSYLKHAFGQLFGETDKLGTSLAYHINF